MLISTIKEDKYMKLIMAIILPLLLIGCTTSQGQGHDYKVTNQEVQKQDESHEPLNLKEREGYRQSNQY
jgi:predicted small secreted protein